MNEPTTSAPAARARREFVRSFDSLEPIHDFVQPLLDANGADAGESFAIVMTIEELFTNMVKYNAAGSGAIGLDVECRAGEVVCRLSDPDSERFDVTAAPDVDVAMPVEQRRPGGLGLHLIRRLVDSIDYDYSGRCSTITFRKALAGMPAA